MSTHYKCSIADANRDFEKLFPYLGKLKAKNQVLDKCDFCLAQITSEIKQTLITDDQTGYLVVCCHQCSPLGKRHKDASFFAIPEEEEVRISTIQSFRNGVIDDMSSEIGFPLVCQALKCDGPNRQSILFTGEKVLSAFVPWIDGDPLILGGQIAQLALLTYNSIASGKTSVFNCMGNSFINTSDKELAVEIAKVGI